jgi:ABC-type enterochelin transport system permease subunit
MHIVLIVIAILTAIAGALMLTQATMGVGVIAFGIFLAALARVVQAERHHSQLLNRLE